MVIWARVIAGTKEHGLRRRGTINFLNRLQPGTFRSLLQALLIGDRMQKFAERWTRNTELITEHTDRHYYRLSTDLEMH